MDSKSNTATLLTSSKSRNNYHFRSEGGNTTRYIVGSIGRACRAHARKDSQHQHTNDHSSSTATGQQRNQNVAIATQVINPSAIGGSFKNRRFVEHFGPRDDDQVSFLSRRRRTVFGKACWYMTSIAVTLMMVTGLILAVGYLQSEKQRISTRPVKLAQGQSFESLLLGATTTTQKPPILQTPAIHPPKDSLEEEEDDDMDEIGVEDYLDELGLQSLEKDLSPQKVSSDPGEVSSSSTDSYLHEDDHKDSQVDSSENELSDEKEPSPNNEKVKVASNVGNESYNKGSPTDSVEDEQERSSEVKVLPPPNFNGFSGLSFEFPIYRAKGLSSDHQSQHVSASNDDSHANSAETPTQEHTNDYETKEESKKNLQNSTNFTSLLDSDETEYEHEEEALSNDDDEKNYANAHESHHKSEQTNNKKDLSIQKENAATTIQQQNLNNDDVNATDTESTYSPPNNENQNNYDFETASSVKLQTDLFDNNEELADFETSASEEFAENERFPPNRSRKSGHNNEHRLPAPSPINHVNKHDSHSFRSQSNRNNRNRNNNTNRSRDDSSNTKILPSSIEIIDSLGDDDELEKVPPPPPQRNDPRKLSLRPPSHYDRNKSKLNPPKISPSKDLDKVLLLDDPPKEQTTSKTNTPPQTQDVPILEYKVDFAKFLSSTTTAAPPTNGQSYDLNQLIAQLPPGAVNPYPDFKFDFSPTVTTPAPSSNDGANLDNINLLGANNINSNHNFNLQIPSATTDFNLNLAQLQPYSSNQIASNTIQGSSGGSTGGEGSSSFDAFSNQGNQFSKRTFNNFDLSASGSSLSNKANTNSNPFAHLLGPQSPTTGAFGSASSAGATLNLFQPQQSFNFDTSASNPQGAFNIPSGSVPVDLSASHIPVKGFSSNPSSSSDLPYPNLDTTGSYNQPNKFSFNSYDISNTGNFGYGSGNNDIPILTTRNGQIPNYNTITQGINLLKLLAPAVPQNQNSDFGFSFDDQHSSGSSSVPSFYSPQLDFSKSEFQIPSYKSSLGTTGGDGNGGGHSFLDYWKWKNSGQDLHSSPSEIITSKAIHPPTQAVSGFDPRSAFRSIDTSDDLVSSGSSFSKAIVSKAHDLKNSKLISSKISTTSSTTEPNLLRSLTSKKSDDNWSQPRSISISILPKPVSSFVDALTKRPATIKRKPITDSTSASPTTDPASLVPKSRKRVQQDPPSSPPPVPSPQPPPLEESAPPKRHPELRLKSGFFT